MQARAVPGRALFEAAGYEVAAHGLSQWNGVAIVSRVGIENVLEFLDSLVLRKRTTTTQPERCDRSRSIPRAEIVEAGRIR